MNRLKRHAATLKLLHKASPALRKGILQKGSKDLTHCLCDCAHNILKGNVPLTKHQKRNLSKHKTKLRQLTKRNLAFKKKQKNLQTGGFLPILLSALAPVLGSLVGGLLKK